MTHDTAKPTCVGFIMDGNRRWARQQGLKTLLGHKAGYELLKKLIDMVEKEGIPHMVCYAFSTENWNRETEEVGYLMELLEHALVELLQSTKTRPVRIRVVGERSRLPASLKERVTEVEEKTRDNTALTVWIALSYGGRLEIVDAVNRAIREGAPVTEASFEKLLWTGDMPDPDMIIRTAGEKRLSNFLLWKSSYSELFFTDTLWPDFGETEFKSMLEAYGKRERRNGV